MGSLWPCALLGCMLGLVLVQLPACAQNTQEEPQLQQGGNNQSNTSIGAEKAALLEVKAGLADADAVLSTWIDANHVCSWQGVGCDVNSQVISLDLSYGADTSAPRLHGTINWAAISKLSKLELLNLGGNRLGGTLGPVPSTMRLLNLSGNKLFNGTIPADWAKLPALQELSLQENALTGTIPSDWSQTALERLMAGLNLLEGPLPQSLPPSLAVLAFEVNRLTGTIPSPLPPQLTELKLGYNRLSGTVPPLPPQLTKLSLSSNSFTGKFPTLGIGVESCFADDNQLSGQVLPDLWGANLSNLSIAWNTLTGTLPPNLMIPTSILDLAGNALTGTVPLDSWTLPSTLRNMNLSNNALSGSINNWTTPIFSYGDFLSDDQFVLDLSANILTGSIPLDFAQSTTIPRLVLSNNSIIGALPEAWSPDTNFLQVDRNYLEGTLPSWPNATTITVVAAPQKGAGLCGQIPANPWYGATLAAVPPPPEETGEPESAAGVSDGEPYAQSLGYYEYGTYTNYPTEEPWHYPGALEYLTSLPDCPEDAYPATGGTSSSPSGTPAAAGKADSSSGSKTSAIVGGIVAGAVAIAAMLGGALWWRRRHARSRAALKTTKGALTGSSSQPGLPDWRELGTEYNRSAIESRLGQGLKEWEIEFDKIRLVKQIGEGSHGRVYMAMWRETRVAVKVLLNTALDICSSGMQQQPLTLSNPVLINLHKEAGLMASLRHPNIVGFLGVCRMPPAVVTEFCSRGSLADILRAAKEAPPLAAKLTWQRKLRMLQDTARGMLYLHERQPPLIHRDLKSPNLLVDQHWRVKVADFNVSKLMEGAADVSSPAVTNPRWLAPEVLSGEPATMQSDSYAYGLVMWEALALELPFEGENHFQLIKFITNGGRPPIPELTKLPGNEGGGQLGGLDGYIALMQRCWAQAPEERPSFQEIVPLVRDIMAQASQRAQKLPGQEE